MTRLLVIDDETTLSHLIILPEGTSQWMIFDMIRLATKHNCFAYTMADWMDHPEPLTSVTLF